ncbi:uncharacterized protein LOC135847915 [Planococcus citri]|uniref:uncharacterized protein LOC135847915 n=1 Tax=Planococcus citri TaxID=170843 RepID=UPI0031F9F040
METTMMRPTYATTYLMFILLLSHIHTSTAIFSALASMAKGLASAVGLTPSTVTLSSDPNVALKQLPEILKQRKLQEVEVNIDEALKSEAQKIYDLVDRELKAKLPKRTEPLV